MITIVDYKAGNLTSVQRALAHLSIPSVISSKASEIAQAERIIFPGVGHAEAAMASIREGKIDKALHEAFQRGVPIMGICLGTQIILAHSEEGDTPTLNLLAGSSKKFVLQDNALKIPHMGWNSVKIKKYHPILKDLKPTDEVYFVHSYYPQPADTSQIYATTEYEIEFPCAIGEKNLFATQFHPEKSGPVGLQMLLNFASWDGTNAE